MPPIVHEVLGSAGEPLAHSHRAGFEAQFGADLRGVRVHTDQTAAASARGVGAAAYTAGDHVVFGPGTYAPGTAAGDRLLAHELTHVLQQRKMNASPAMSTWRIADASDPAEVEADHIAESAVAGRGAHVTGISRSASGRVMRALSPPSRVMVIQRQKAEGAGPAPSKKSNDPLQAESEALAAVADVENDWTTIAAVSRPYKELVQWVRQGDKVVGLIRSHTNSDLAAIRADDRELVAEYKRAAQTDKITYDYIAWHVVAYVNLLSLKSWTDGLVNSFDHDDRAFTGRANAERITRDLQARIKGVDASSQKELSEIHEIQYEVRRDKPGAVTITVTSPAIGPERIEFFRKHTAAMRDFQVSVQRGVGVVNQFLEIARKEGFHQAKEAIEEYYKNKAAIDAIIGGRGEQKEEPKLERPQEPEKGTERQPLPSPHPFPAPVPEPDDPKKPKCPPFVLRVPAEKAPHLNAYRNWLGTLQDDPSYRRPKAAQEDKWRQEHRIGAGAHAIPAEVYDRGHKLGLTEDRIRVPDWTRTRGPRVDRPTAPKVNMQVDHIIELQVTPPSLREAFDSVDYYELLTRAANAASGNRIRASIAAERKKQEACDPSKKGQVLIFDQIELGDGQPAERWTSEEIRGAEQLDAYEL